MAKLTTAEVVKGLHLGRFEGEERIAQIVADVNDDAVAFAGQGKNHGIVHLISGANKAAYQPHSICGLWVSNKKRAPLASEKVCSKCTRGGTSFSNRNQPRPCAVCGRIFADNATGDNTDQTCGTCYEAAGYENAHVDGFHAANADGPQTDCPLCRDETPKIAGGSDVETERVYKSQRRVKRPCLACGDLVKVKRDRIDDAYHAACRS